MLPQRALPMRVTTVSKKRQPIDDVIDALVWMRRKQPNLIFHTFPFLNGRVDRAASSGGNRQILFWSSYTNARQK